MKQLLVFSVFALALLSCSGGNRQATSALQALELDSLLVVADKEVDKTVTVVGYVTHTCKHSGKKCFLTGESQKVTLRVEAGSEIGGFSSELVGSKLAVTGILREHRLSQEYIDKREDDVKQLQGQEGNAEACAAELNNISDMRKWMEDHDRDYFVIYYMDGLKYEKLD